MRIEAAQEYQRVEAILNTIINFLIVSFVILIMVRVVNKLQKPASAAAATTKDCGYCCTPIPPAAKRCPHCTSTL